MAAQKTQAAQMVQDMIDAGLSRSEMDARCDAVEIAAIKVGRDGDQPRAAALLALVGDIRRFLTSGQKTNGLLAATYHTPVNQL